MDSAWISIKGISYSLQIKLLFKLIWILVLLTNWFPHFMIQKFLRHIYTVHCLGNELWINWTQSAGWYVNRSVKPFVSQDTLKIVYSAFVHSVMNCRLIYWRNSSHNVNIFNILKNMFRIIIGSIIRELCRGLYTSASAFTIYTALFVFVANSKNN